MRTNPFGSRRQYFFGLAGAAGTIILNTACRNSNSEKATEAGKDEKKDVKEENVSPAEDLMREHGVLDRVLLIYEEFSGASIRPKMSIRRRCGMRPGLSANSSRTTTRNWKKITCSRVLRSPANSWILCESCGISTKLGGS
jgi:hypothetical protein